VLLQDLNGTEYFLSDICISCDFDFFNSHNVQTKLQRHLWLNALQIKHFLLWNGFYVLFSCLNVIVTMYEGFRGTFEFFPFDLIVADN
jgi:hypothetical protein